MSRVAVPLNDTQIKKAKPKEKGYKLFDGQGLFLWIDKTGGKLWRLKYKSPVTGKEKTYSMGRYPDLSLLQARGKRQELRAMIAQGIDPMIEKQTVKIEQKAEEIRTADTFRKIALDYFDHRSNLSAGQITRQKSRLSNYLYPAIGDTPITEVTRSDIITAVQAIADRGTLETAHRTLSLCISIFKYAAANEKIPHNILADIDRKNILKPAPDNHYPVILEPEKIKHLLAAIDEYDGQAVTRYALQLLPYLAARPGNVRAAKWGEIDFENSQWVIPGENMKIKVKVNGTNELQAHTIFLSLQALEIIKELHKLTGDGEYLFPSAVSKNRPMSDNTLAMSMKRLGYKGQMNPHSFRAMFSTILHEKISDHGFHSDVIERALAHKERNKVKAAYDHSEHLPQRKELMQWWADWLDEVRK